MENREVRTFDVEGYVTNWMSFPEPPVDLGLKVASLAAQKLELLVEPAGRHILQLGRTSKLSRGHV